MARDTSTFYYLAYDNKSTLLIQKVTVACQTDRGNLLHRLVWLKLPRAPVEFHDGACTSIRSLSKVSISALSWPSSTSLFIPACSCVNLFSMKASPNVLPSWIEVVESCLCAFRSILAVILFLVRSLRSTTCAYLAVSIINEQSSPKWTCARCQYRTS